MTDITDRPAQAGEAKGWIFHFAEAARWAAANPGAYRGGRLCAARTRIRYLTITWGRGFCGIRLSRA